VRIKESEQFKKELRAIALYIRKDKPNASIKFIKNLKTAIKNLIYSPYQYRPSIYFEDQEIRDMIYYGYTIIYEVRNDEDTLEILTIFNQNLPDLDADRYQ